MPTHMSISVADQIEIFKIIIQYPEIINWLSIGRHEPSADAVCDAVHFMVKDSIEREQMEKALLKVFNKAKKVRYYRQLKLLSIMFDTYKNKEKTVKQSLLAILQQLVQAYINNQQNFKPLSYSDLKK